MNVGLEEFKMLMCVPSSVHCFQKAENTILSTIYNLFIKTSLLCYCIILLAILIDGDNSSTRTA